MPIDSWGTGKLVLGFLSPTSSPTYYPTAGHTAISASLIQFQIHMLLGIQLPPDWGVWSLPDSWVISPCGRGSDSFPWGPLKARAMYPHIRLELPWGGD